MKQLNAFFGIPELRRGYNGLVDIGYPKHFRVNHSVNEFANEIQISTASKALVIRQKTFAKIPWSLEKDFPSALKRMRFQV
ncbi:hypothetical protein BH24ACI3_BH24ACI3_01510 [soil metagenome]